MNGTHYQTGHSTRNAEAAAEWYDGAHQRVLWDGSATAEVAELFLYV